MCPHVGVAVDVFEIQDVLSFLTVLSPYNADLKHIARRGYRGQSCGQASWGKRYDGSIVRLSNKMAAQYWAQLSHFANNITRLDLQVTTRPKDGPALTLSRYHNRIRRAAKLPGRPPKFKCIYGPSGPETLYLGSRQSDWFGRIYDKGVESGLPEYKGALRYEVELKRDVSSQVCAILDSVPDAEALMSQLVYKFVSVRTRGVSWRPAAPESQAPGYVRHRSLDRDKGEYRKELWLRFCVGPAVRRMVDCGREQDIIEWLGLSLKSDSGQSVEHGPTDYVN